MENILKELNIDFESVEKKFDGITNLIDTSNYNINAVKKNKELYNQLLEELKQEYPNFSNNYVIKSPDQMKSANFIMFNRKDTLKYNNNFVINSLSLEYNSKKNKYKVSGLSLANDSIKFIFNMNYNNNRPASIIITYQDIDRKHMLLLKLENGNISIPHLPHDSKNNSVFINFIKEINKESELLNFMKIVFQQTRMSPEEKELMMLNYDFDIQSSTFSGKVLSIEDSFNNNIGLEKKVNTIMKP